MSQERDDADFPGPVVIGAGPSGLAVAACLSQRGIPSLVLERCDCIASLWRHKTYDHLTLHLPKNFCELPLMGFPCDFPKYPTKRQLVAYLESYASRFGIVPMFGQEVMAAEFDGKTDMWRVRTRGGCVYATRWLVVATGENAEPNVQDIPGLEKFRGPVVHTSRYKSGSEYRNKRVLVVGCGNSGMEVSLDLCRHNAMPHMVVRNTVHVLPREMFGLSTFGVAMELLRWLPLKWVDKLLLLMAGFKFGNTDLLGLRRPKTGPIELKNATGRTPVLDVRALSQIKAGNIKVMRGVKEVTKTGARFVDGQEKEFDSIVLATGYNSNISTWLKVEYEDEIRKGWKGDRGLYAVGFTGKGLLGIGQDAARIAADIAAQWYR